MGEKKRPAQVHLPRCWFPQGTYAASDQPCWPESEVHVQQKLPAGQTLLEEPFPPELKLDQMMALLTGPAGAANVEKIAEMEMSSVERSHDPFAAIGVVELWDKMPLLNAAKEPAVAAAVPAEAETAAASSDFVAGGEKKLIGHTMPLD